MNQIDITHRCGHVCAHILQGKSPFEKANLVKKICQSCYIQQKAKWLGYLIDRYSTCNTQNDCEQCFLNILESAFSEGKVWDGSSDLLGAPGIDIQLIGSEKQIKWAKNIIEDKIMSMARGMTFVGVVLQDVEKTFGLAPLKREQDQWRQVFIYLTAVFLHDDCGWWISIRDKGAPELYAAAVQEYRSMYTAYLQAHGLIEKPFTVEPPTMELI
jgi:hypothetical protein